MISIWLPCRDSGGYPSHSCSVRFTMWIEPFSRTDRKPQGATSSNGSICIDAGGGLIEACSRFREIRLDVLNGFLKVAHVRTMPGHLHELQRAGRHVAVHILTHLDGRNRIYLRL